MSATSRELWRWLWVLSGLTVLTTLALYFSFTGVHTDAVPLASSSTAGVLDVDTAKDALTMAQQDAQRDAYLGAPGSSDFYQQIAIANQSLARAAAEDVTGPSGRQTLQTLEALIGDYADAVGHAGQAGRGSALNDGLMHDAADTLGSPDAGPADASAMGRLNALQQEQLKVVDRQASFGWPLWVGWTLSAGLVAALAVALARAHRFTRVRFRHRWNRQLAACAALLLVGAAVLAVFTWQTHTGLFHARALLHQRHSGTGISAAGASVARRMADTGFRAAAADGIVAGGVLLTVLIGWALLPRINEYRFRASR
jgi:hypothetical protein